MCVRWQGGHAGYGQVLQTGAGAAGYYSGGGAAAPAAAAGPAAASSCSITKLQQLTNTIMDIAPGEWRAGTGP